MWHRSFAFAAALVLWSVISAHGQTQALLSGTVTDESAAVLPGATVTATELSTGRQYVAVADDRGAYRLVNMEAGTYKVQAELQAFATVVIPKVELLVGQRGTLAFVLKVAGLEETFTVTGEAPLVNTASAQVAGNVDRRQMEELPLQGRNWIELSMMVKGITSNAVGDRPGVERDQAFQLNLDGQQITQKIASSGFGQPKLSREAIAEFQVITNLFDVTQGRSYGVQVQAISRAGTNKLDGAVYGYFRDDKFNAADFVAGRVLPYANQQMGVAMGGPIVRDKVHFFGVYEYERQPNTIVSAPPALAGQTFSFPTKDVHHTFLGRGDWQLSARDHVMVRGQYWRWQNPFTQITGTEHPSQAATRIRDDTAIVGSWTRVLSDAMVHELKVGYSHYYWLNQMADRERFHDFVPSYVFPGLTVGARENYTQEFFNDTPSFRYDLSWHRGRQDFKIGGEYLAWHDSGQFFKRRRGEYFFTALPDDLSRRIPADAWNDPSRWDFSGLDPIAQRFDQFFAEDWSLDIPRPTIALWLGDTWRVRDKLTFNLGVRWDYDHGVTAPPGVKETDAIVNNGVETLNLGYKNGIRDFNNLAPRFGFTYSVREKNDVVVRGGTGLFYSVQHSNPTFAHQMFNGQRVLTVAFLNDGTPGFIADPRRGITADDILSGRVALPPQSPQVISPGYEQPYTWQSVLGIQKQIGDAMAVDADLTYWRGYDEGRSWDPNLFFDPITGYNLDPRQFGRPNPQFDAFEWRISDGKSDYMALATSFSRRYRNNFQAGLTYTLMFFKHDTNNLETSPASADNQFDLDAEWARSTDFQRHTMRANGIYRLPFGFSLAAAYFFGSGNYFPTFYAARPFAKPGVNRLNIGAPIQIPADVANRFDGPSVIGTGEVVPRNALKGDPLHKLDLRLTKEFSLGGDVKLSGIAELFNVLNHSNFGTYNGQINSSTFGQPRQDLNGAYLPRVMQLAFRLAF